MEVMEHFVPLKLECNFQKPTDLMKKYHVRWTPTLYVLESDGSPRFHTVGYMPPDELAAHLELVLAMNQFDGRKMDSAISQLRELIEKYPGTAAVPQAIYYEGVANYMKSHNSKHLKKIYLRLREHYPESLWAKKSLPYADLSD
jgi:hypothetical protein